MRVGIIYSGVGGPNGADYVANMLRNGFSEIGITPEMIGGFGNSRPELFGIGGTYDLLVHSSGFNLTSELVERIHQHGPLAMWTHNDEIPFWRDIIAPVSELVDTHYSYTKKHGFGDHVQYMPLAADNRIYHPTESAHLPKEYDVALIGAKRQWRADFMDLMGERFKAFVCFSMVLHVEEINDIYNRTRVVLAPVQDCDEDNPGAAWGCPCRTFDVPAAGAFQIQVRRGGLDDVYPHSISLPPIRDVKEAADMWTDCIERWIAAEDHRREQARADYEWTMAHNLYRHRAEQFIEGINK